MPAPEPKWSRLEPAERREQIIAGARRLFAQRPYAAVSMTDVARATGVTRGLVHHYFATKPDLYETVVESLLEEAPSVVRTDLELPVEEMVARNAEASLVFIEENRELMFAITQPGGLDADPRLAGVIDRAREAVVDRMLFNHLGSSHASEDVRTVIRGYLGLFEAAAREWLVAGRVSRQATHVLLTRSLIALIRDVLPALADAERDAAGGSSALAG